MSKILVLGDGLLGSEIVKQTGWDYVSRKKDGIDFTDINTYKYLLDRYGQIINCIGVTNTYTSEFGNNWKINYISVMDLVDFCQINHKKLIHISTDYIYSGSKQNASENDVPVHAKNWYSYTKLLSDAYVQARMTYYLLIRTSFKPKPFPYEKAITQFGNFDYVDIIAKLIIQMIEKNAGGVYNVGTETKSMLRLARETNPNVIETRQPIHETMPLDVTMDISKMKRFLNE